MDTIKINKANTKLIAHRGLSGLECGNTNAAFVAAGNRSYFGIETDVHVTADGRFAVFHDDITTAMSGVLLEVEKSTYDELRQIRLYDMQRDVFRSDLVIPQLHEYIRICKRYEKTAVLELKNEMTEDNIRRIAEQVDGEGYLENTVVISFKWHNLELMKKHYPEQRVQFLTDKNEAGLCEKLKRSGFGLDIEYRSVTSELIKELHASGLEINCWTCNDKETAERLVSLGVDYITTNILE